MAGGYWRPKSVSAAKALKGQRKGSLYLAGGTDLLRLGSLKKSDKLIDLEDAELSFISPSQKGDQISIGSMVTFTQALESDLIPDSLKEALMFMGSLPKRNMATIGGNVMCLSSCSYLIPTLAAYDAQLLFSEEGEIPHCIDMDTYLAGPHLWEEKLLLSLCLNPTRKVLSKRFSSPWEGHAAVTLSLGGGDGKLRMAAAIHGSGIQTLEKSRKVLEKGGSRNDFHEELSGEIRAESDVTGSEAYKRYLVEEGLWSLWERMGRNCE